MATLGTDKMTKTASEAAEQFIDSFYSTMNTSRDHIASFYMEATTMADGKSLPVIVYNGNVIEGPTAMQALFKDKMPDSLYEVQNFDCHVVNPHYVPEDSKGVIAETGKNMTILVSVSGEVKYGQIKTTPIPSRGFSESFVLVPNPAAAKNERKKPMKDWLIQSQNFRLVF